MIRISNLKIGHNEGMYFSNEPDKNEAMNISFDLKNNAYKTIKEAVLFFTPLDSEGKVLKCTKTGTKTVQLLVKGPILKGYEKKSISFSEAPWVNTNIKHMCLEKAYVTYEDGSREKFSGESVLDMKVKKKKSNLIYGVCFLLFVAAVILFYIMLSRM